MGEVLATIRVMPEDPEIDLEQMKQDIQASIPEGAEFHKIEEEPIAFGLVALDVMVIVDDAEGGTEQIEENLAKINGVSNITVTDIGRLM